jgi:Xaa-Pro aminopeptidase
MLCLLFNRENAMSKIHKPIAKIQQIMKTQKKSCWVFYSSDHSDPYFSKIISPHTCAPAFAFITPKQSHILVHHLDSDNLSAFQNTKIHIFENEKNLWEKALLIFSTLRFPKDIYLNYSSFGDTHIDVLGHGLFTYLQNHLRKIYREADKSICLDSSQNLLYAFLEQKEPQEIKKLQLAGRRALELLEATFARLKPGVSELDVMYLLHSLMEKKPNYFKKEGILEETFSWEKAYCPIVLAGANLQKGGHAMPSKYRIKQGDTVYMDFGVCLTFKDGSHYSSDIQRMGYLLKKGQQKAPKEVQEMFDVLVQSIALGMKTIRAGIKGYEVDEIVRSYITSHGYPNYDHGTGHPIAHEAHAPGAILAPKQRARSHLLIQPNGVYSIEPRIAIFNGGSIEEMVLVTSSGGKPLCRPQKELYLI